jgi:uncharacterized membrane protein
MAIAQTEKNKSTKKSSYPIGSKLNSKLNSKVDTDLNFDSDTHIAVTIGKPVAEVFKFFRNFENLPRFMKDLKEIRILSDKKSHWVVEIKAGYKAEWDAQITQEKENQMIAWSSVEGSEVDTEGVIWFLEAPMGLGTQVILKLDYSIPGGKPAEWLTMLKGEDPNSLAFTNLRRLKCFLETGEIATTVGQSSGRDEDMKDIQHEKELKH